MTSTCLLLLCTTLVGLEELPEKKQSTLISNCVELGERAEAYGLDPSLMISIGHTESRFNKKAKSRAGAMGMLQVLPKYFCPKKGRCDYTDAGFEAWTRWSNKRTTKEALCRYNSGRKCAESKRASYYSRTVLKKLRRLSLLVKKTSCPGCECSNEDGC